MKRYTVAYLTGALEELALSWESATDRSLVAHAADTADKILVTSPIGHSVYLGEDLWRLEVVPLRFYFTIREEDRLVEVSNVIFMNE